MAPDSGQGRGAAARTPAARIPALLERLEHAAPATWQPARRELVRLRGAAVAPLTERVRDKRRSRVTGRVRAVQVLGRIGEPATGAVSVLLDALPEAPTRLQAAIVLALVIWLLNRRENGFWESSSGRRNLGRLIAGVSVVLWIGVVLAGRWIAYSDYLYWEG